MERFIKAADKTNMSTPVYLRLDEDDPELDAYLKIKPKDPSLWTVVVGERVLLSEICNLFYVAYPGLSWYGFLADDLVPETDRWDRSLVEAAGNDNLAYAFDGRHKRKFAAHFVLGGKLVESVGYLALSGLHRIYIDTAWNDIAREREVLRYLPDVRLIHHHFSNGLARRDETYKKPHNREDREIYFKWRKRKGERV